MKLVTFFVQHELKFKALIWLLMVVMLLVSFSSGARSQQVQIGDPVTIEVTATVVDIATIDPRYAKDGTQDGWNISGVLQETAEVLEICDDTGHCEILVVY